MALLKGVIFFALTAVCILKLWCVQEYIKTANCKTIFTCILAVD